MSRYERAVVALWGLLFIAVVMVWCCSAKAAEPAIVPVQAGQPAPFAGQLIPPLTAARMGVSIESCDARIALDVAHAEEIAAAQVQYQRDLLAAADQAAQAREYALRQQLDEQRPRWYQHPAFIATVSVIGGALAVLLGAVAIDYVEEQK